MSVPNLTVKNLIYFTFLIVGGSNFAQAFQSGETNGILNSETLIHGAFTLITVMGGVILKKLDTEITRNRNSASKLFGEVSDLKLEVAKNYSSKEEMQNIHNDIKDRFDKLEAKLDSFLTR